MKNNYIGNIRTTVVRNYKSVNMNEKPIKTDSVIKDLQEAAKSFKDYADIYSYMEKLSQNNPDCIKLDSNQYKYKDFYINTCLKFATDKHVNGLKSGTKMGLSSCPQFVDYIPAQNGTEALLIFRIEGTEDSNVVPYYDCKNDVSLEAKKNFMNDIDTFVQAGFTNSAIQKPSNWFVVPSTKRIIVANWSEFSTLGNEQQKTQYKNDIAATLGLVY